jgi:dephospho-CoA kinase
MTDRRVLRMAGILRRHTADMPLDRIQHLVLERTVGERILGLGTIGFATAGTAGMEAYWISVDRAEQKIGEVRRAMAAAGVGGGLVARKRLVVIGVAGGIGSGKSRVADEFGRLGAVVIDSDVEAKQLLDRPDVRETLRGWWGDRVIGQDGRVDRKAVAHIVFTDPEERRRLEMLVHPLVKERRADAIERARRDGREAVVVDAPLLFEAGVDAECDAVVFVEAPVEVRRSRVRKSRGWDTAELARRESQQLELAEKRRRSLYVIANDRDQEWLTREAARVYRAILGSEPGVGG